SANIFFKFPPKRAGEFVRDEQQTICADDLENAITVHHRQADYRKYNKIKQASTKERWKFCNDGEQSLVDHQHIMARTIDSSHETFVLAFASSIA
ncbi:hypothetical protein EG68_02675, partial [Paragonimus skrjabini miyazakii]